VKLKTQSVVRLIEGCVYKVEKPELNSKPYQRS